jgi:hypothetical protein
MFAFVVYTGTDELASTLPLSGKKDVGTSRGPGDLWGEGMELPESSGLCRPRSATVKRLLLHVLFVGIFFFFLRTPQPPTISA